MPGTKSKPNLRPQRWRQAARRRGVLWAVVGGLGLFVAWQVISNPLPTTKAQSLAGLAPDITLTTQQGEYRLSEQKGETVALFFAFVG
ncbi:MAG: hypothetical protein IIB10_04020 [Chloroflexi bacterium]|nr:hypothetical protein [Chloroflexota bacterium]